MVSLDVYVEIFITINVVQNKIIPFNGNRIIIKTKKTIKFRDEMFCVINFKKIKKR